MLQDWCAWDRDYNEGVVTVILKVYPVPLYEGEGSGGDAGSSNVKAFPEPLTVELLKRHQALMN